MLFSLAVFAAGLVSCNKNIMNPEEPLEYSDEIVFKTKGISPAFNVSTKATVVNALASFYASATTGAAESEVQVWNSQTFTSDGAETPTYSGDKWWPITDPSYHFYASNSAITFDANGCTVAATNATDVVCAYMSSPTYKVKNTLTFNHIFARLGTVTVTEISNYTISGMTISITPKTGGTYNIRTGAWSSPTTGSATVIADSSENAFITHVSTNVNDIYLVPGTYTLTATWTATKGNYTQTFSSKTADVTLVAGKVNNISANLTGDATELTFGVEITEWDSATVNAGTFPVAS